MTSVAVQCDLQPGSFAISWPMGKWVVEWLAKSNSMAIWAVFISYELGRIFLISYVCSSHLSLESMFSSFSFNLGDVQEMAARLLQLEQENAKVIVRSCWCAWSEILTPKIKHLS